MERQNLQKSMEKLKADATSVLLCARRLKVLQKHNEMVEANTQKRSQELELKEKDLQKLSLDLEERCEIFTKEQAEASSSKKMVETNVEKRSQELELKEKELQSFSLELNERVENFEAEKAKAGDLKKSVEEYTEEVSSKKNQLTMYQRGLEILENKLREVKAELRRCCSETQMVQDRKIEIEEETDRRMKGLASILDQIKESGKQFVAVDEHLELKEKELQNLSLDLDKRPKMVEADIEKRSQELELKAKELQSLSLDFEESRKIFTKEKAEAGNLKKMVEECTEELRSKRNQLTAKMNSFTRYQRALEEKERLLGQVGAEIRKRSSEAQKLQDRKREIEGEISSKKKELALILDQLDTKEKTICRRSSELEEKAKKVKVAANDLSVRSHRFRKDVEDKEKKLDLLRNQIEVEEKKLIQLKREMEEERDRRKKDLELILSEIEESSKQLESQSRELVSKVSELECVGESSKRFNVDLEVKEKRVQELNNLIKISDEQLELKSKELGEVEKRIEEQRKNICEPVNESAASVVRDEVSRALRASPNPAELVLDLVQEYIREGSGLKEDSSLDIMLLFIDGFAKLQLPNEPQPQLKAREVATLWKEKITIEAPNSSLEALAFLLFIVAYGLTKSISQEETALLASSVAQYEQAPTLFKSLGLTLMIPEFVNSFNPVSTQRSSVSLRVPKPCLN